MKILFVCTGNTCRSPMAEGMLKKMLKDRGIEKMYEAASMGTFAHEGEGASKNAIEVMNKRGVDISSHKARGIAAELLSADLILTMTRGHRNYLRDGFPQIKDKVFLLDDFVGGTGSDILDPYGGDVLAYDRAAEEIISRLERLMDRLENS